MTEIISVTIMNLATPKAGAKHELLFSEPASEAGLLNKCLCLALALCVAKFPSDRDIFWSHFVVLLKSDFDVQQTHLRSNVVEMPFVKRSKF